MLHTAEVPVYPRAIPTLVRSVAMSPSRRTVLLVLTSLMVAVTATLPASGDSRVRAVPPTVSVSDISVGEGTGGTTTAVFTITQSRAGRSVVTYKTKDGTASSPADYQARTGKVRFAGKKTTRTVSITVNSDSLHENDETFSLVLTDAKDATISGGEAVATIHDDDPQPDVSIAATSSVPEGQVGDTPSGSVEVTLSAASGLDASVDWSTGGGTATADIDYTTSSGTVSFAPGETSHTVLVSIVGDDDSEGDETFDVTLSSPVGASLGNDTSVVTIVDNDPIPPGSAALGAVTTSVREGRSGTTTTMTFSVERSDETTTAVTVDYATVAGTAIATMDYFNTSGTLSFAAGQTKATVDVTVKGDARLEHGETVFLNLTAASTGAAIVTGQATGTIVNDDTRTVVNVRVRRAQHAVAVHGRVSPAQPRRHEIVRLYRRRSGSWVRLATKRPVLRGSTDLNGDHFTDSRYATSFSRPKKGRCKVVASLPKSARFSGSQAVRLFAC
jgi:hypothetical protein